MAEAYKTVRLGKAATEFNVGVDRVIDLLVKNGFEEEFNFNTKLTAEMYALLAETFARDKVAKESAQSIKLEYTELKDKQKEESAEKTKETKEVVDETPAEPTKEVKAAKKKEETPKSDAQPETDVKPDDSKEEAESKPKTQTTKKKATVSKKDKEKTEVATPDTEDAKSATPAADKAEQEKPEVVADTDKVDGEATDETVIVAAESESIETIRGPKVLGKIDIDQFAKPKGKAKPEKKSAKEVAKAEKVDKKAEKAEKVEEKDLEKDKQATEEKAEVKATEKEPAEKPAPTPISQPGVYSKDDDNFIKTRFKKLEGPNIIDKIELPEKPKTSRKPVASSSDADDKKGKKRKRKRVSKTKVDTTTVTPISNDTAVKEKGKHKEKPSSRRKSREERKPELTDEEIQKQISETLQRLSGTTKSKSSRYRREKRIAAHQQKQEELAQQESESKVLKVVEFITVNDLANLMDVPVTEVISKCMSFGVFVSINERLDAETITILADEFGFSVEFASTDIQELAIVEENVGDPTKVTSRTPIVTVMGHVDHGKTSLLDYIRNANVVAGEAGGITQHVGAYEVKLKSGNKITFIDTPGHEAFTAMRARGAKVTDIVIIVIAADSGVMPQTKEAINHAKAAGVPIIFAINKIDVPEAKPEKIKEQLSEMNILVEDWGGKYQSQEISAKKGINVDLLLEKVLLEAEMLELKANPTLLASGTVIEAMLDKGRGYLSKCIVEDGTLRVGDFVVAGTVCGKIRSMFNERNAQVKEVLPGSPISILGLNGAPQSGDKFIVMRDEREAKNLANQRLQLSREVGLRTQKHVTLDEIGRRIAIGDFKELNLIVKGDVDGSIEALSGSLLRLSNPEVQVNVIHKSVGAITESDVSLAIASNAIIIGFQVRPTPNARRLAEKEEIDIRIYSIIYSAINEIKQAIEGMLAPEIEEKIVCNIEVREVFHISKVGTIAGCMVLDGKVNRNTKIRVIRDGIVIHTGTLGSLKRFKDDVREVSAGYECGLNIANFNDVIVGDIIEGYEEIEIKRKL
ncbi:MAG: translation initiation factor IF-2 [Lentimicrobiaceae bacterium]|nr:translation initiation factor IF-2 [Lentimicrobiaceae bacterium]